MEKFDWEKIGREFWNALTDFKKGYCRARHDIEPEVKAEILAFIIRRQEIHKIEEQVEMVKRNFEEYVRQIEEIEEMEEGIKNLDFLMEPMRPSGTD